MINITINDQKRIGRRREKAREKPISDRAGRI
jgi:hypothetical protein